MGAGYFPRVRAGARTDRGGSNPRAMPMIDPINQAATLDATRCPKAPSALSPAFRCCWWPALISGLRHGAFS